MGELLRRLGKFIQGLFKKNKKPEYESVYSVFGTVDTDTLTFNKIDDKGFVEIPSGPECTSALILNDGVLYIDGQPFGTVKSLSWDNDIDEGYREMERQLDKLRDLTFELIGIRMQLSILPLKISFGIPVDSLPNIK